MPFFVSKTKALANGKTKCRPIAHNPFLYPPFFLYLLGDTDSGAGRQPPHHRNEHGKG